VLGRVFFEGVVRAELGKIPVYNSSYEARFEVISVLLLKIRVFWYCGLLGPDCEGTMMLRSVEF
jgi:hypothetical protein